MLRILLAVLVMSGMAMAQEGWMTTGSGDVIGQKFVLSRVDGKPFTAQREVFVEFGDGLKLSGRICNAFNGQCEIRDGILKMENIASSRMLCPDEELRKLEADFFNFLRGGISIVRLGDTLEMRRDGTTLDFTLAAAKTDAADNGSKGDSAVGIDALAGKKFTLATINGEEFRLEQGVQPFIEFARVPNGVRVTGKACNNFVGPGELEGGTLTVEHAAATMMMCIDPKLMEYEQDFFKLLRGGGEVRLDGKTLTLSHDGHTFEYREGE